jgi:hypothetical protein
LKKRYGWYITMIEIARSGLFNQSGLTAIRSAEKANLYEVMFYLSFQADVSKANELAANAQKQTSKRK